MKPRASADRLALVRSARPVAHTPHTPCAPAVVRESLRRWRGRNAPNHAREIRDREHSANTRPIGRRDFDRDRGGFRDRDGFRGGFYGYGRPYSYGYYGGGFYGGGFYGSGFYGGTYYGGNYCNPNGYYDQRGNWYPDPRCSDSGYYGSGYGY